MRRPTVLPASLLPSTAGTNPHGRCAKGMGISRQSLRVQRHASLENGPRSRFCTPSNGRKMTEPNGRRVRGSFSFLEVLSVVAILLILVMVAVPFPYASRNHWLAAPIRAVGPGTAAAETKSSDRPEGLQAGKTALAGYAPQGSPYEVRTVGRREFCADMPGVVRFSTTVQRCRNGKLLTNTQLRREQLGH